jgi:hypothetical protein
MNDSHQPRLGPWQTADLANGYIAWDPLPDHGVSLTAAVAESGDWLSAAVLAGYVPSIDGIRLALRAYQQFCLSKGGYLEATGDSLVGPAWAADIDYPGLIDLLKEANRRTRRSLRRPDPDPD